MTAVDDGAEIVLSVDGLVVEFTNHAGPARAVDGVNFEVRSGEIVALVGESGSGKSVTAMAVLGLLPAESASTPQGRIDYRGNDLLTMSARELRALRGNEIAMIFQDPMTALNPVHRVGRQIAEAVRLHSDLSKRETMDRAVDLLDLVGVAHSRDRARDYPHQFSGGMRQRVMIAMAIANNPSVLIADEPTTALDVTIQAQVLDLLRTAQRETGAATILITHDLGVVAETANRVLVMYAGRIVEHGDVQTLFAHPRHPYTAGLLRSLPRAYETDQPVVPIPGSPPSLHDRAEGCPFEPRCSLGKGRPICRTERPPLYDLPTGAATACHFHDELATRLEEDHV